MRSYLIEAKSHILLNFKVAYSTKVKF